MRFNNRNNDPVTVNEKNIEDLDTFVYLIGAKVSTGDGGTDGIKFTMSKQDNSYY